MRGTALFACCSNHPITNTLICLHMYLVTARIFCLHGTRDAHTFSWRVGLSRSNARRFYTCEQCATQSGLYVVSSLNSVCLPTLLYPTLPLRLLTIYLLHHVIHSGKNMLRILDDILLVAKGSHSLNIKEETVNVSDFIRQTVADMTNFAYME